jgi:TolB protein
MHIFLLLFLVLSPLFASEEEIVVHLSSRVDLSPVHMTLSHKESGFEKHYCAALEKVLRFDFDHNGITEVVQSAQGASQLKVAITQKTLSVKLVKAHSGVTKGIEGIALTGELNQDRQTLHRIHDTLLASQFDAMGIASQRVLYTHKTPKKESSTHMVSDVWTADYDGANARQTTHTNSLVVTPIFVPSQKTDERPRSFLYVSYQVGQPKIFAAALGEGIGKRLTFLRGNQLMPTISPTLDKMAFISDITGNPDLFVQDFSLEKGMIGKPRQVFCAPSAAQGSPSFSPCGKKLAFVSNKDGTPRIYILDIPPPGASVNNLKPRMITKKTRENTSPAWSADGGKIAYSALAGTTRQIWIYDLATGEETQLTDGAGHKENPAWAPNNLHLMFNSSSANGADLYLINLNQKKAVKVTQGLGEKRFPAWEPKPQREK